MEYVLFLTLTYFVGAIPSGYLTAKLFNNVDVRNVGTGNVGTMNTMVYVGYLPGFITLFADVGKAVMMIYVSRRLFGTDLMMFMTTFFVVLGHNYSVFLKFKGGKGLACLVGLFLWIAPLLTFYIFAIYLVFFSFVRSMNIASALSLLSLPFLFYRVNSSPLYVVFGTLLALLILTKHIRPIMKVLEKRDSIKAFEEEDLKQL